MDGANHRLLAIDDDCESVEQDKDHLFQVLNELCVCVCPAKKKYVPLLPTLATPPTSLLLLLLLLPHSLICSFVIIIIIMFVFFFSLFCLEETSAKKNNPNSSLLCYISRLIVLLSLSFLL